MPTEFVFANFMAGELLAAITADAEEISITPSAAARLELFGVENNKEARLTLWDGQREPEIVGVLANPQTGILQVTRAQEGTTAYAWEAGTQVRCAITAAMVQRAMEATLNIQEILQQAYLPLAGGTMTGPIVQASAPTDPTHLTNKSYVDGVQGNKLPLTGGTMAGSINMNSNRLLALPAAVADTEPLRKIEHDTAVSTQAKLDSDRSGTLVTTGTADAFTVTTAQGYTALVDGTTVRVRFHAAAADSATFQLDATVAKALQRFPGIALTDGAVLQDAPCDLVYSLGYDAWLISGAHNGWDTGDIKLTTRTTATPGFLMMADQTIGNTASAADVASTSVHALFLHLWNTVSDSYAPVNGGRGATAAADWAANKKMTLTKVLGRALAVAGAGSGLTSRALGQTVGTETVTLAEANLPTHSFSVTIPSGQGSHNHTITGSYLRNTGGGAGGGGEGVYTSVTVNSATLPEMTGTTNSYGGGGTTPIMQPTAFLNVMIHL